MWFCLFFISPVWGLLVSLCVEVCVFHETRDVFSHGFFKYFLSRFFFLLSPQTSMIRVLDPLLLSRRFTRVSAFPTPGPLSVKLVNSIDLSSSSPIASRVSIYCRVHPGGVSWTGPFGSNSSIWLFSETSLPLL